MYFFLEPFIADEKTLTRFTGTMYYDGKKFQDRMFKRGVEIDESKFKKPFKIIVDESDSKYKKRVLTDRVLLTVVHLGIMLLVSPRVVSLFKKLKLKNVQFFDVEIQASDFELSTYKLMNIIGKYDCMDEKKSEVQLDEDGDIFILTNLVLDHTKIPKGQQLFLLGRDSAATIIAHEDLKRAIEDAGLTGIGFEVLDKRQLA
jgi:hypothetical protein